MAIAWRDFGIVIREMLERQIDGIKYVLAIRLRRFGIVNRRNGEWMANGWQMDGIG